MPKDTFPAAGSGLPSSSPRIPAGKSATILTERRGFLRALAGLPLIGGGVTLVGAPTAVAEPADPIFAALAEYKRLDDIFGECCRLEDEVAAKNEGREITEAERQIVQAAADASNEAFSDLLETVPTSMAGLRALLETVLHEALNYESVDTAMRTALKSPVFVSGMEATHA